MIAEENKKIIGYAQVGKTEGLWELLRIYISPVLIGKGIGAELMARVEKFLKKKKATKYIARPHVRNQIAKNFYKKMGFKREPRLDEPTSPCYLKQLRVSDR